MNETKITPSFDGNRSILGEMLPLETPFNVIIDTSERCNFQCGYCFRSDNDKSKWGYARENQIMDWGVFEKVVEQIREFPEEVRQISLSGHGEPLCNRKIPDMVRYIKAKGIRSRISMHTNASLLDKEMIEELAASDIDRIVISLQGLSERKYLEVCHAQINFEQFYDCLTYLYERKRHTQIHIKIMDVALEQGEEEKFYQMFLPIADRVYVEQEVPIWKGVKTSRHETEVENKYGDFFPLQECCPLIFHTIAVVPNGDVYPCTQLVREDKLGNIKERSLRELWESEYRKTLLMRQCELDNPEVCKRCYIRQNSIYTEADMIDKYRMDILERLRNSASVGLREYRTVRMKSRCVRNDREGKMLIADYIADCIAGHGIKNIFTFTGGASGRLIDSVACHPQLQYFCNLHEQAGSMAADAFSRLTGELAVVIVTSGPGATNLVTGCAGAYYDSVPVLFITGQVASGYLKDSMDVRQNGFQETDVLPIFSEITKYAARITKPEMTLYEIEKAMDIAMSGRKGPVLIDLPEDFQRMEFEEERFVRYCAQDRVQKKEAPVSDLYQLINESERPLFAVGQGVHAAMAEKEIADCINKLKIPAVFTFGAMDILPASHEMNYGNFGINGHAEANALIQNADLIIFAGTRLDHHLTGKNISLFSPKSKKILLEIDEGEIKKFDITGISMQLVIHGDAKAALQDLSEYKVTKDKWEDWNSKCRLTAKKLRDRNKEYPEECFHVISRYSDEQSVIVFDTGCSLLWGMHYFSFKSGQRCISQFNHTAMGYALPAAIGAALACPSRNIVCITGDGGIQLNIQELATVRKNGFPIKIVVFDNEAYALMHGAQNEHMQGRHAAASATEGLPLPDLEKIIKGYEIPCYVADKQEELETAVMNMFSEKGPAACIIKISSEYQVKNQIKAGAALSIEEF